jgi:RIO kinase 1
MASPDGLAYLVEEGVIDAVHAQLMSGKEATVYVVERAGFMGAAKVYRDRDDRTFKKVSSYVEGRNQTRNSRDRRAMDKKTSYGRGLLEEGWQDMEFRALRAAWGAGVRVPEPFFLHENVLFMELVVDAQGAPAGRLADFGYTPEQATSLHLEIFLQVKALLETGLVHGDLSAYNVLMGAQGPTIIDLPQVVDVSKNRNARHILRRDLRNVTEHLARFDARLLRFADCGEALFRHLERGTLAMVTGPEESALHSHANTRAGGRRGRDAERGRAGRDKGRGAEAQRLGPPARAEDRSRDRPRAPHGTAPTPTGGARPPRRRRRRR